VLNLTSGQGGRKLRKVLFVHDLVFKQDKQGAVFGGSGLDEKYFDRFFCSKYDEVTILSRVQNIRGSEKERFKNKNIKVTNIMGKNYLSILNPIFYFRLMKYIKQSNLVVISIPSVTGAVVALFCNVFLKPYAVEVAGDGDAFLTKKGGRIFSIYLNFMMPFYIKNAQGAAYVTKYLAAKFPNEKKNLVSSNVNIEDIHTRLNLSKSLCEKDQVKIGFVGGLNKRKGVDTLIRSAQQLIVEKGYTNLFFCLVGAHADFDIENLLSKCNIKEYFFLHGLKSKKDVFRLMQTFDLYVQPSLSEGLPRATIEAMSFGLPVVATQLPGFEEILEKEDLVRPGDVKAFVIAIETLLLSKDIFNKKSCKNLAVSSSFLYEKLHKKRCKYYRSFTKD
jgi:glycosyltransferase involved in cell wall biosynthesis